MPASGEPPSPSGARNVDELSARLRALQAWAGLPYREVHRRVVRGARWLLVLGADRGGRKPAAAEHWHRALQLFTALATPDADEVRETLAQQS